MNENLNPDNSHYSNEELDVEKKLRPLSFDDFTGQEQSIENLKIFVQALMDHFLYTFDICDENKNKLAEAYTNSKLPDIESGEELQVEITNIYHLNSTGKPNFNKNYRFEKRMR